MEVNQIAGRGGIRGARSNSFAEKDHQTHPSFLDLHAQAISTPARCDPTPFKCENCHWRLLSFAPPRSTPWNSGWKTLYVRTAES